MARIELIGLASPRLTDEIEKAPLKALHSTHTEYKEIYSANSCVLAPTGSAPPHSAVQ